MTEQELEALVSRAFSAPRLATAFEYDVAQKMYQRLGIRPPDAEPSPPKLSPREAQLLALLCKEYGATRERCVQVLGLTRSNAARMALKLWENGLLYRKYARGNKTEATYYPTHAGYKHNMEAMK